MSGGNLSGWILLKLLGKRSTMHHDLMHLKRAEPKIDCLERWVVAFVSLIRPPEKYSPNLPFHLGHESDEAFDDAYE